jgi:GTPase SAR1 family protein
LDVYEKNNKFLIVFSSFAGDFGYCIYDIKNKTVELVKFPIFIKTLILGDSEVGKTSTAYYLCFNEENKKIRSTHGMRFFEYELIVKETGRKFIFDIWDFGGQPGYQISHKQNYKKARLIWLVVDLKRKNVLADVRYWINSIKEHKKEIDEKAHYFIIGTKTENDGTLETIKNFLKDIGIEDKKIKIFNFVNFDKENNKQLEDALFEYVSIFSKEKYFSGDKALSSDDIKVFETIRKCRLLTPVLTDEIKYNIKKHKKVDNDNINRVINLLNELGTIEIIGKSE